MAAVAAMTACSQGSPISPSASGIGTTAVQTGNGGPSGAHYNLNLIGVPNEKTADITDGNRIFVRLTGNTKILLGPGETFDVIDGNGTDGEAAFQLPNPDPDGDGTTVYSVFARELGKPGGTGSINTCATGPGDDGIFGTLDDEEVCSLVTLELARSKGKSTFRNVSRDLLYIYADIDGTGVKRFPLFDDDLQGYFWDYDNNGLRVVQLRFYECSSTVPDPTDPGGPTTTTCFD
jgi:hypothetical protein